MSTHLPFQNSNCSNPVIQLQVLNSVSATPRRRFICRKNWRVTWIPSCHRPRRRADWLRFYLGARVLVDLDTTVYKAIVNHPTFTGSGWYKPSIYGWFIIAFNTTMHSFIYGLKIARSCDVFGLVAAPKHAKTTAPNWARDAKRHGIFTDWIALWKRRAQLVRENSQVEVIGSVRFISSDPNPLPWIVYKGLAVTLNTLSVPV